MNSCKKWHRASKRTIPDQSFACYFSICQEFLNIQRFLHPKQSRSLTPAAYCHAHYLRTTIHSMWRLIQRRCHIHIINNGVESPTRTRSINFIPLQGCTFCYGLNHWLIYIITKLKSERWICSLRLWKLLTELFVLCWYNAFVMYYC